MKDKYIIYDELNTLKNIVVNYSIALNEASSSKIYKTYLDMFLKISKESKELFDLAYANNFYSLEEESKTKITKAYNKLIKELENISI